MRLLFLIIISKTFQIRNPQIHYNRFAAATLREARNEFIKFQRKYQKTYASSEISERFAIFKENLERAESFQKLNPKAKFGVTKFSDLSTEEFAKYYLNR